MIVYIVFLIYSFLTSLFYIKSKKTKKQKIWFLIANFIPLIIISGFRSSTVGIDTKQFTEAFSAIIKMAPNEFDRLRYEYGFSYLCWILGKFSTDPQILIFTTSMFINVSVARFIYKNSDDICLSTILYVLCNFFFSYMNIMRQAIAIAIILWGFEYLKEKKYIKYSIFVVIASLFHGSALLALLLIVLRQFNFNRQFLFFTLVFTMIGFVFGKKIFLILANISPRLFNYVGGQFYSENYFAAFLNFLVYLVSFIFGIVNITKNDSSTIYKKDNNNNILIGIIGAAVIFSALTMKVSLFNRFTPYFSIFLIIWLANTIKKINNLKYRQFYLFVILITFSLYWSIIAIYKPEWYGVIPYNFVAIL